MKIKTEDLTGPALNWAAGQALKLPAPYWDERGCCAPYSTDWSKGGPIIEREKMQLTYSDGADWGAYIWTGQNFAGWGPTPLVAAMRCFVASRLGDEVDVPDELMV